MNRSATDWIAYLATVDFPNGDAGTRRVLGMSRTIAALGYRVAVASLMGSASPLQTFETDEASGGEICFAGMGEYDRAWPIHRKLPWILHGCGATTMRWLDEQSVLPSAVIVYGSPSPLLSRLIPWSRRKQVPIVCDIVEWHPGKNLVGGTFGPVHLSNEYAMRRRVPRVDGVIGISRFLCDYYSRRGMPVVRVPPTLDIGECPLAGKQDCTKSRRTELVYAGVPGKKDLLGNVLEALRRVDAEGRSFRLHIFGPDARQIKSLFPRYPASAVEIHGRKSHAEILAAVAKADFTVLLRPDERYAHAGFSTKVVESLSCGTPVICNLTSDLAEHIRDGETGLICRNHTADAFAEVLAAAKKLNLERLSEMRDNAWRQAQRAFDYRAYVAPVRSFFDEIGIGDPRTGASSAFRPSGVCVNGENSEQAPNE